MRTQVKADLMLVLVTFFWGISYLLTDLALGELGPFTLNALRFLIAFAAAGLLFFRRLHSPSRATLKLSLCTGAAFLIQAVALQYTTASHVGVIFCLEPVFNSILAFFVAHEVLTPQAYFGGLLLLASLLVMETDLTLLFRRRQK